MAQGVIPKMGLMARLLTYSATALAVSGCAQSLPTASSAIPHTLAAPLTQHFYSEWMYASQPSGNEVSAFKRKRNGYGLTLYTTLTGFAAPMGMVATPDGRLYIANSGDSNILVYRSTRKGPKGPKATLSDPGEVPVNVDATPNQRLVAVSNSSTTKSGPGSVSVYLNRRDEPSRILSYGSDPVAGAGIAIDASGNCYWSFNDPDKLTGSIVKFTNCNGRGTLFRSGILRAAGLAFDKSGNLYYVDQLLGVFKCVGSSCYPFIELSLGGLVIPTNINFDNGSPQNLWVADAAGSIDAVSLQGLLAYILDIIGGVTNPPNGIAPSPGG